MELITLILSADEFTKHRQLFTYVEYKAVEVKDDMFKNDEVYQQLRTKSIKAYKELKEYEFKKRHNI
jgi:hypothetical protein